jgi:hypothetical protein
LDQEICGDKIDIWLRRFAMIRIIRTYRGCDIGFGTYLGMSGGREKQRLITLSIIDECSTPKNSLELKFELNEVKALRALLKDLLKDIEEQDSGK